MELVRARNLRLRGPRASAAAGYPAEKLISDAARLLHRSSPAGRDTLAIKLQSQSLFDANRYFAATPDARYIFLYRDALGWISSFRQFHLALGLPDRLEGEALAFGWAMNSADTPRSVLADRFGLDPDAVDVEQLFAASWVLHLDAYRQAAAAGVPFEPVRYNDLLASPREGTARLFIASGLDPDSVDWASRPSQKGLPGRHGNRPQQFGATAQRRSDRPRKSVSWPAGRAVRSGHRSLAASQSRSHPSPGKRFARCAPNIYGSLLETIRGKALAWSGVSGIHHTALDTADFDVTLAFYTGVLGFKAQWTVGAHRIALLDAGGGSLLEVFERERRPVRGEEPIAHFAFKVADCKASIEHVRAAGCPILVETTTVDTRGGHRSHSGDHRVLRGPLMASTSNSSRPTRCDVKKGL